MSEPASLKEGKATFAIGNAFYRHQSQVARDLGILAAALYKLQEGQLRVLDVMSGCGVRSLRYWLESQADWIWSNDNNPDLQPLLTANLQEMLRAGRGKMTCQNALEVFSLCFLKRDYYDFIDLDAFGSPAPYLTAMLRAAKIGGLLYLTSTDGRTATGHQPEKSLQFYGSFSRCHPASQEQVLRVLIGSICQQAGAIGLGIEPVFSLFHGQSYRLLLRLSNKPNISSENYGFLGYCHQCGEFQIVSWRKLGKVACPCQAPLTLTGPLWLGPLHCQEAIAKMQSLAQDLGWEKRVKLLSVMEGEIDFPPYFYTLGEIGRRGKLDLPSRLSLIRELQERGYEAASTHIHPQGIKTNANLGTCIDLGREIIQKRKPC